MSATAELVQQPAPHEGPALKRCATDEYREGPGPVPAQIRFVEGQPSAMTRTCEPRIALRGAGRLPDVAGLALTSRPALTFDGLRDGSSGWAAGRWLVAVPTVSGRGFGGRRCARDRHVGVESVRRSEYCPGRPAASWVCQGPGRRYPARLCSPKGDDLPGANDQPDDDPVRRLLRAVEFIPPYRLSTYWTVDVLG